MSGLGEYGVLKGKVVGYDETNSRHNFHNPHVYIYVKSNGDKYKILVNVRSSRDIFIRGVKVSNELLYTADPDFKADKVTYLQLLNQGYYPIKRNNVFVTDTHYGVKPEDIAIDYVRSGLFDPCSMKIYKHDIPKPNNDLTDFLVDHMRKAQSKNADIYVYGERFHNPLGMHDVHMNQGSNTSCSSSSGRLLNSSDGVYQDGCILLHYNSHWEAIFLAFQSQSWCTDDVNGNKIDQCYIYNHKTKKLICDIKHQD
jgi:uncharacterized protein YukJ